MTLPTSQALQSFGWWPESGSYISFPVSFSTMTMSTLGALCWHNDPQWNTLLAKLAMCGYSYTNKTALCNGIAYSSPTLLPQAKPAI